MQKLDKVELIDFIGIWENEFGNILEIRPNDNYSLKVNFISGITGKPVILEYFENKESVDLHAELSWIFMNQVWKLNYGRKEKGFNFHCFWTG